MYQVRTLVQNRERYVSEVNTELFTAVERFPTARSIGMGADQKNMRHADITTYMSSYSWIYCVPDKH